MPAGFPIGESAGWQRRPRDRPDARKVFARAFSYAAPGIRNEVGRRQRFLDMVRTQYPVVYRPTSVQFLKLAVVDGKVFQAVQMTDANGALWLALYGLELQRDKSWRINGCIVQRGDGQVI